MNSKNSYPIDFELLEIEEGHGPYRKGYHWAQASESSAVDNIKQMFGLNIDKTISKTAKDSILKMLSKDKVRKNIETRLKWIMHNL